ncbi:MAG: glutathione S-transferase N-terminal domain-containing protein [Pseudomonadota bacterium]
MKLVGSPTSPYVRKIRIQCLERNITIEFVPDNPFESETLRTQNPLGRVPVLISDDGCIYDSPVIMEYLDTCHDGPAIFPKDAWDIRIQHALCDGILDSSINLMMERRRDAMRSAPLIPDWWVERQYQAIDAGLRVLQDQQDLLENPSLHAGQIGAICTLGYLNFRFADLRLDEKYPHLAIWGKKFEQRASVQSTQPPA